MYYDELKDCESWKGRWHQRYIYGEHLDCKKWKQDFDNCVAFRKTASPEAAVSDYLVSSLRRMLELILHTILSSILTST